MSPSDQTALEMLRVISLVRLCPDGRPGVRVPENEHLNIRLTFPQPHCKVGAVHKGCIQRGHYLDFRKGLCDKHSSKLK